MATTDTTTAKTAESSPDGEASKATSGDGAKGTRRKLSDAQEREVTRLYAATETPVSEISKRFGIGESSVYRVAQRHGAALRGRTATSAKSTGRPAAKVAKVAKVATAATAATAAPGGRGRGRGRAAGTAKTATKTAVKTAKTATKTTAKTTAKTAAKTAKTAVKTTSGNGRRTPATRARAAATPAKRTAAAVGRPAKRAPRGSRAAAILARREFRVSYVAVRVFVAANMAEAIRQAEAAGATDITGIERRA